MKDNFVASKAAMTNALQVVLFEAVRVVVVVVVAHVIVDDVMGTILNF